MKFRLITLSIIIAFFLTIGIATNANKEVVWTENDFNHTFANLDIEYYEKKHDSAHLSDHIGLNKEKLLELLQSDKRLKSASTYPDQETAKRAITTVLSTNSTKIVNWLNHPGSPEKKSFHAKFEIPVGSGIKRSNLEKIIPLKRAVVVLVKLKSNDYSIATSFPE